MGLNTKQLRELTWGLLLAGSLLTAVAGCGTNQSTAAGKPKPVKRAAQAQQPPADTGPKLELSQKGVTLRWAENGVLRMSASAREFRGNEITKTGELIDFSAQLYDKGKPATSMVAPNVLADTVKRIVTATGGVTVKSLDRHTVIKAKWVKWYEKEQKIVGNGGVTVKSDVWDVQAAAFVADTALKTVSVRSSAKGL